VFVFGVLRSFVFVPKHKMTWVLPIFKQSININVHQKIHKKLLELQKTVLFHPILEISHHLDMPISNRCFHLMDAHHHKVILGTILGLTK